MCGVGLTIWQQQQGPCNLLSSFGNYWPSLHCTFILMFLRQSLYMLYSVIFSTLNRKGETRLGKKRDKKSIYFTVRLQVLQMPGVVPLNKRAHKHTSKLWWSLVINKANSISLNGMPAVTDTSSRHKALHVQQGNTHTQTHTRTSRFEMHTLYTQTHVREITMCICN